MRIAIIAAGAGSMYCGACARDGELAHALLTHGHDVVLFPIYTPLRLEKDLGNRSEPVLIGGINAYLREKHPSLRNLPKFAKRWLDRPSVLNWASQFAIKTQASDLGQMTVSFLRGTDGPHAAEITHLADCVKEFKPDVILLANTLLAGLIDPLSQATGAPVVCEVQGEDGFLDELPDPWKQAALDLLRKQVLQAAHFIAPCKAHAEQMGIRLGLLEDRFSIVPPSVRPFPERLPRPDSCTVHIGHLSSIRKAKGLDVLVKAISELEDISLDLSIRGRVLEPGYFEGLRNLAENLRVHMRYGGEATPDHKASFLASCDFVVLPSRLNESRGIAALEALAAGTPVIAPTRGIFSELAVVTQGVALYDSDEDLAGTIRHCIARRIEWRDRGIAASKIVSQHYSLTRSASAAEQCFQQLLRPEKLTAIADRGPR